jgi:enamine deaminase RidA (YjgF/YER057c/UK114 family)
MSEEGQESAAPSPHRTINPESLGRPWGFSHAVAPGPGRTVYLAGQTGHGPDDSLPQGLAAQFDAACRNVVAALVAAGGRPEHVVSMQIFTTDLAGYVADAKDVGRAYRAHFGRHFVATGLFGISALIGGAKVEIMCVAVIPES